MRNGIRTSLIALVSFFFAASWGESVRCSFFICAVGYRCLLGLELESDSSKDGGKCSQQQGS